MNPSEYLTNLVNDSSTNLNRAAELPGSEREMCIKAAEVQASMAIAIALVDLAAAVREGNSPGLSIRYGLEPLVQAVSQGRQA